MTLDRGMQSRVERALPVVGRLAKRVCRDWPDAREQLDELVSLGNLAVVESARTFDAAVQPDFVRFAFKRARGAMLRFVFERAYGPGRATVRAIHEADADDAGDLEAPVMLDMDEAPPETATTDPMSETVARLRRKVAAHAMLVHETLERERQNAEDGLIAELDLRRSHAVIATALETLSERQRLTLHERVVEKRTLQEVAEACGGVSVKTVQRDLAVALTTLGEALVAAGLDRSALA